jgi:hypothetical protein
MKRNYYNIYKDGELVHKGITSGEVTRITGINNVYKYSQTGTISKGYKIELSHQIESKTREGETKQNELLDVWDDKTKSYVYKRIKRKDLLKKFNITSYRLSQYISRNYYLKDRYLVTRAINEKQQPTKWTQEQINTWNDIREAAELLRTGKGKIVQKKVKGKWKRYTEVTG